MYYIYFCVVLIFLVALLITHSAALHAADLSHFVLMPFMTTIPIKSQSVPLPPWQFIALSCQSSLL